MVYAIMIRVPISRSTSIPELSLFAIFKMEDAPGITLANADVPRDQILQDFFEYLSRDQCLKWRDLQGLPLERPPF